MKSRERKDYALHRLSNKSVSILVFKSSGRNDCFFFFNISTHKFFHRDYFDKNHVPWSNLEEIFLNIVPLLESSYVHYHIKY